MHAPETHEFLANLHPVGRMGETRDIVDAVLFLEGAALRHRRDPARRRRPERRPLTRSRNISPKQGQRTCPSSPSRSPAKAPNPAPTSVTPEEKAALIKGASQLLLDVLKKPLEATFVVIDEVDTDNWGWGGLPVARRIERSSRTSARHPQVEDRVRRCPRPTRGPTARCGPHVAAIQRARLSRLGRQLRSETQRAAAWCGRRVGSRLSRDWCSTNSTAKPSSRCLMTRPTQAPTASGVPTAGCTSAEIATPDADMSMMKQLRVLPSAKVKIECGLSGTMRACFRWSRIRGSRCFFSSQVSLFASFSRSAWDIARSRTKPPAMVSLM